MPRVSDLTEAEDQYLASRHAVFRQTPSNEKDAFREVCAKHIMTGRGLDLDNEYVLDLFVAKVRNWFQNNAPVKKTRLLLRINNDFHPQRVWGMLHQTEIREGLLKSRPDNVADDAPHVVVWNAKRKELWDELDADEQAVYQRMAVLWSEEGPDDDLKPQMAERRAVAWMKAVALLFWQQCRMPVFIYGCFEDTKAQLQGATFDTSLLFESTKEGQGKPTFRQSKEWATDFRAYFYNFFTPYIRPDLASPEAMEYLRTTSKKVVQPFEFDYTDDGWPLLPKGDKVSHTRRQEILRKWFKELYGLACGREVLSAPWSSIVKVPHKFFAPGMLYPGFHINDPSHIRRKDLIDFYAHVQKIQFPPADAPADASADAPADASTDAPAEAPADLPTRFEFSHYEEGPEDARTYPDAINMPGDIEAWQPRRAKKPVRPPTFDPAPGATDGEDDDSAPAPSPTSAKRKARGMFNPGPKFYKDMKKLQREKDRTKTRLEKEKAKAAKKKAKKGRKGKGKASAASDEDIWVTDEDESPEEEEVDFDAIDNDVPEDESELSDDEDGERAAKKPRLFDDLADDSDDEVEEELERYEDVLSSSAVRKNAPASAGPSRSAGQSASVVGNRIASALGRTAPSTSVAAVPLPADIAPTAPAAAPSAIARDPGPSSAAPPAVARGDVPDNAWSPPPGADLAPIEVPADGPARLSYLKSLDKDPAYVNMLARVEHMLTETTAIRVQPPLFWASWGYKSPFLPKDAHEGDKAQKTLDSILKFLKKGPPAKYGAVEAQRYCLVMGLAIRNIMALQFFEPGDDWPKRLPTYMVNSPMSFPLLQPLLAACDAAFRDRHVPPPAAHNPPVQASPDSPSPPLSPAKSATKPKGKGTRSRPAVADDEAAPTKRGAATASKKKDGATAKGSTTAAGVDPQDSPDMGKGSRRRPKEAKAAAQTSKRRGKAADAVEAAATGAEAADASEPADAPKKATRRSTRLRS